MTEIVNADWYSMNEQRMYPVTEIADGEAVNGSLLSTGTIVDLMIRYTLPDNSTYHYRPYIAGVFSNKSTAGVSFEAEKVLRSNGLQEGFLPLGAVSVANAEPHQIYEFDLEVDGYPTVQGFIVFGSDIQRSSFNLKFEGYANSGLVPSAARPAMPGLKPAVRINGVSVGSGMISLRATNDAVLNIQDVSVVGEGEHRAIVIGLVEDRDTLISYVPNWAELPETNPDSKQPITSVNGIPCRNINFGVDFINVPTGMADILEIKTGTNAVLLDATMGWAELCELDSKLEQASDDPDDYYDPDATT